MGGVGADGEKCEVGFLNRAKHNGRSTRVEENLA